MMKKAGVRFFSLFLSLCLLLSLCPPLAVAEETAAPAQDAIEYPLSGECGDSLSWELGESGELALYGSGEMWDYTEEECPGWESAKAAITAVILPEGLTHIGDRAFYGCVNAVRFDTRREEGEAHDGVFYLPSSLLSIGAYAFSNCDSVRKITMSNNPLEESGNVLTVGEGAFAECDLLQEVSFSHTVTEIPAACFYGCLALSTGVTGLPEVRTVGKMAFAYCIKLRNFVFPQLESIGEEALLGCVNLDNVALEVSGLKSIGRAAFKNASLCQQQLTLSATLEEIGEEAFYNTGLRFLTLPASLKSVGDYAFYNCRLGDGNLPLELPASLSYWGAGNGSGENGYLSALHVDESNESYTVELCGLYRKDLSALVAFPGQFRERAQLVEGVEAIGEGAFALALLSAVLIPASVGSIGDGAFADCACLTDVYYCGSEEQWAQLAIGADNEPLMRADIHFDYSYPQWGEAVYHWTVRETEPLLSGGYDYACTVSREDSANQVTESVDCSVSYTYPVKPYCGEAGEIRYTAAAPSADYDWITGAELTLPVEPLEHLWSYESSSAGMITYRCARCGGSKEEPGRHLTLSAESSEAVNGCPLRLTVTEINEGDDSSPLLWTCSQPEYAALEQSADGRSALLTPCGVYGSAQSLTVSVCVGSGKSNTATLELTLRPQTQEIEIPNAESLSEGEFDVGAAVTLEARCIPADAMQTVRWSSSNPHYSVDEQGVLHYDSAAAAGSVKFTCTAADGSGQKESITLRFTHFMHPEDLTLPETAEVAAGKTIALPYSVSSGVTNKKLSWTLDRSGYGTLSSNRFTASRSLSEKVSVVITAGARDGSGVSKSCTVTICPAAEKVTILNAPATVELSGRYGLSLGALVSPADASQGVSWSSSKPGEFPIDENGHVSWNGSAGAAKVTFTATSTDGSRKKATVKLSFTRHMTQEDLSLPESAVVASGKSVKLDYSVNSAVTNPKLSWSVSNPSVVKLSGNTLSAVRGIPAPTEVLVTATAQDGSGVSKSCTVTVYPVAERVLLSGYGQGSFDLSSFGSLTLSAAVEPALSSQEVTWSSSNKRAFPIDENGTVTAAANASPCSVTFTATAKDGSGKKATVRLSFSRLMRPEDLSLSESAVIGVGRTLELKYTVNEAVSNKHLSWSLSDPSLGSLSGNRFTPKSRLSSVSTVLITATAKDGSGVSKTCSVTIYPTVASTLRVSYGGQLVNGKTLNYRQNMQLVLENLPYSSAQSWTVSTTDDCILPVLEGNILTLRQSTITPPSAAKGVKLTIATTDGSNKKSVIYLVFDQEYQWTALESSAETFVSTVKLKDTFRFTTIPGHGEIYRPIHDIARDNLIGKSFSMQDAALVPIPAAPFAASSLSVQCHIFKSPEGAERFHWAITTSRENEEKYRRGDFAAVTDDPNQLSSGILSPAGRANNSTTQVFSFDVEIPADTPVYLYMWGAEDRYGNFHLRSDLTITHYSVPSSQTGWVASVKYTKTGM